MTIRKHSSSPKKPSTIPGLEPGTLKGDKSDADFKSLTAHFVKVAGYFYQQNNAFPTTIREAIKRDTNLLAAYMDQISNVLAQAIVDEHLVRCERDGFLIPADVYAEKMNSKSKSKSKEEKEEEAREEFHFADSFGVDISEPVSFYH